MNLQVADYGTIIKFGTNQDLNTKLQQEGKSLADVKNDIDENGVSLLEKCLAGRKFDIAKLLLQMDAEVNIVSKEGYNEFHYLAANINSEGAIDVAKILLKRNTSLLQQDKKFGNTALFTLCQEVFKKRSVEGMEFLILCLEQSNDLETCNKAGNSVRKLINERGTDQLKAVIDTK